jgi:hypothetical protein
VEDICESSGKSSDGDLAVFGLLFDNPILLLAETQRPSTKKDGKRDLLAAVQDQTRNNRKLPTDVLRDPPARLFQVGVDEPLVLPFLVYKLDIDATNAI